MVFLRIKVCLLLKYLVIRVKIDLDAFEYTHSIISLVNGT